MNDYLKNNRYVLPKIFGQDIILIFFTIANVAILKCFHQTALIVSPPCFVTLGRVLIFIGRLVTPLSVDFVAHK